MKTVKIYAFCINDMLSGQMEAFDKQQVKQHCEKLAEIFAPNGIKTLRIVRIIK